MTIHPDAKVDPSARLATDVTVGPYAFIGPGVELSPGCLVEHHASISRDTKLGPGCRLWPYASVGSDPQDLKYKGEQTFLEVGAGVQFREFVTVNRGSGHGGGLTRVGDNCLLMAYSHVAHDCRLGREVILANAVTLAGHVEVEDYAQLGGMAAVHQFVRIGRYCFVGGMAGVSRDLAPFTICDGNRALPKGLNKVGLKRAGFSQEALQSLGQAFRLIFRTRTPLARALAQVRKEVAPCPEVEQMLRFIESSQRGVAR